MSVDPVVFFFLGGGGDPVVFFFGGEGGCISHMKVCLSWYASLWFFEGLGCLKRYEEPLGRQSI